MVVLIYVFLYVKYIEYYFQYISIINIVIIYYINIKYTLDILKPT